MFYPIDERSGEVRQKQPVSMEKHVMVTNSDTFDFKDQVFKQNEDKLNQIIRMLKKRNTKENIQKYKDEYYDILSKVTGKKKQVSMYEILRQLKEAYNPPAKKAEEEGNS